MCGCVCVFFFYFFFCIRAGVARCALRVRLRRLLTTVCSVDVAATRCGGHSLNERLQFFRVYRFFLVCAKKEGKKRRIPQLSRTELIHAYAFHSRFESLRRLLLLLLLLLLALPLPLTKEMGKKLSLFLPFAASIKFVCMCV